MELAAHSIEPTCSIRCCWMYIQSHIPLWRLRREYMVQKREAVGDVIFDQNNTPFSWTDRSLFLGGNTDDVCGTGM